MESNPDTTENSVQVQENESKNGITRRQFLEGFATTGAMAVTAGAVAKVAQVFTEHPEFPKKAYRSITSGKAIEDVKEIIQSRLRLGNYELLLRDIEAESEYPLESWMTDVAESVHIMEVAQNKEKHPILLFDITDTALVVSADKKEAKSPGGSLITKYYDLGEALDGDKVLTLPGPQFRQPKQKAGEIPRYLQYNMYSWTEHQTENPIASNISGQRGGIILTKKGKLFIASTEEFIQVHKNEKSSIEAAMEYAFTIDSDILKDSFEAMEKASNTLLKDMLYSCAFSNAIATIYKENGSFQTFLLASYRPEFQFRDSDGSDKMLFMNPVQLASIAEQLKEKINGTRFVIGITDPSPEASNCYAPWKLKKEELNQKGYKYNKKTYREWMPELGVQEQYFRTVGSFDNFTFPGISFPWLLGTKKQKI